MIPELSRRAVLEGMGALTVVALAPGGSSAELRAPPLDLEKWSGADAMQAVRKKVCGGMRASLALGIAKVRHIGASRYGLFERARGRGLQQKILFCDVSFGS